MADRFYEIDPELDELQEHALEVAQFYAKEKSKSGSGNGVGAALTTYDEEKPLDERVFGGTNVARPGHTWTEHAEENAIKKAINDRESDYIYTDFRDIVIYFDATLDGMSSNMCNRCQATAVEFTHPKLRVFQADSEGVNYMTKLEEMAIEVPGLPQSERIIWPQAEYHTRHENNEPSLPLADELKDQIKEGEQLEKLSRKIGVLEED